MWIETLINKVTCFIPRIWLVNPDEGGVRITPKLFGGVRIKYLVPGWYLVLPIWQNYQNIKVNTQVVDLRAQSIWTSDGRDVTVSGSIRYHVTDAVKAILNVYDYDETIKVLALGIIHAFVNTHDIRACNAGIMDLQNLILKGLREAASGWGLKIEQIYITDTGSVFNLRVLSNDVNTRSQQDI